MATPHEKLVFFSENYDLEELEYVEDYAAEKSHLRLAAVSGGFA
jgi:hypothetical protein